jgi:hypothetical protein
VIRTMAFKRLSDKATTDLYREHLTRALPFQIHLSDTEVARTMLDRIAKTVTKATEAPGARVTSFFLVRVDGEERESRCAYQLTSGHIVILPPL